MALRQGEVVIDCADHDVAVGFWAAALGWRPRRVNDQYVALLPPAARDGAGEGDAAGASAQLPLLFQKVPEGKVVKNRLHLDFRSDDRAAEVARLVALGATEGPTRRLGDYAWTVMTDPEGNEFCVA